MPQSKILVDTNSYLRLAKTVRPLLFVTFGDEDYCLYILPELNEELSSRKLQSKFPWTEEDEFIENRKSFPVVGRKQKRLINEAFDYIWDHVQTELPGPSRVDALYIAYALELNVPVVTDDQDMIKLAKAFDAKVMTTLELLRLMLDCNHTDMKTINGLVEYWSHFGDKPANFAADFKRLFADQSA
ncbi:hypothetical protein GCM10011369_16520 [Neiella marina]|uniref:Uncharacterized protein n=1 Tax=Neiella marina TaxID=508461 RepID=A0A8J2U4G5_9GAMM|nr:DNA-binding protein [Neiella marina]GGA75326.1 hypothetical protein GCM10011369_16520 [Neiella marina]